MTSKAHRGAPPERGSSDVGQPFKVQSRWVWMSLCILVPCLPWWQYSGRHLKFQFHVLLKRQHFKRICTSKLLRCSSIFEKSKRNCKTFQIYRSTFTLLSAKKNTHLKSFAPQKAIIVRMNAWLDFTEVGLLNRMIKCGKNGHNFFMKKEKPKEVWMV